MRYRRTLLALSAAGYLMAGACTSATSPTEASAGAIESRALQDSTVTSTQTDTTSRGGPIVGGGT